MIKSVRFADNGRRGAILAIAAWFFVVAPGLFADDGNAAETHDVSPHLGFYCAFPAYLYDRFSASGIQLGYERSRLHIRLDLSIVSGYEDGDVFVFANPSLGVLYSENWRYGVRTYQGVTFGGETGIANSFEGQAYFLNFMMGAQWLLSDKKAVFLEVGNGMGIVAREGAFNGGTVIGGGFKGFF
jgi:hypothetical protein